MSLSACMHGYNIYVSAVSRLGRYLLDGFLFAGCLVVVR
jgi:hypothetical protein